MVHVLSRRHTARPEYLQALEERVERARKLAPHEYVSRVLSLETDGGFTYVVAEHHPGRPLPRHVKKYGPLQEKEGLELALRISRALSFLYESGLPIGGLEPSHALVVEDGSRARLTQIGLPSLAPAADPREPLRRDLRGLGQLLAEAVGYSGIPGPGVESLESTWTGRTRRLVAELTREEGPPEVEGPRVLERRLEEALYGPSSVPLGVAPVIGRKRPWRPARWVSLASVAALLALAGVAMTMRFPWRANDSESADASDPGPRPANPENRRDLEEKPEADRDPFGEPTASPFGTIVRTPETSAENPAQDTPVEEDRPDANETREPLDPIAIERLEAEKLLASNDLVPLARRMDFVVEIYARTPLDDRARELRDRMRREIERRVRVLVREVEAARKAGNLSEVERICRILAVHGDPFLQYRAQQILAMSRDEARRLERAGDPSREPPK